MISLFFFVFIIFFCLPLLHSATDSNTSIPVCPESFSCSDLAPFKYPFYNTNDTRCGLIKVNCNSKGGEFQFGGHSYNIISKVDFNYSSLLVFWNASFDQLVKNKRCEALMNNLTSPSPSPLLYSVSLVSNYSFTLYKCKKNLTYFDHLNYNSYKRCKDHTFYYNYVNRTIPSDLPDSCQVVQLPVNTPSSPGFDETNIFFLLSPFASVFFSLSPSCSECQKKDLLCDTENRHRVHCLDFKKEIPDTKQTPVQNPETSRRGPIPENLRTIPGRKLHGEIWVLVAVLGIGFITILIIIILCLKRKTNTRKVAKYNFKVELFLKNNEFLAPKRYSYAQVEKMTNSFKVKLGKGGFGTVYKGVLRNQNPVAVKVLSEVKGDGQDFINEVASVGRTSHVNIVSLLGYCLEGSRRALIYEFMPNGSLERFIYSHGSSSSSQLGWEKLHQIAIGIARGLDYLCRGCNTRIIHFDIKPHNILLDNDFSPKISDF